MKQQTFHFFKIKTDNTDIRRCGRLRLRCYDGSIPSRIDVNSGHCELGGRSMGEQRGQGEKMRAVRRFERAQSNVFRTRCEWEIKLIRSVKKRTEPKEKIDVKSFESATCCRFYSQTNSCLALRVELSRRQIIISSNQSPTYSGSTSVARAALEHFKLSSKVKWRARLFITPGTSKCLTLHLS